MVVERYVYGNSPSSGYAIDFFRHSAIGSKEAFLASPFFTDYEAIQFLSDEKCQIKLIVRLCLITPPRILQKALNDPNVTVRYFTSSEFHAKAYIIDEIAMVGSANLTSAGLNSNREISVILRQDEDQAFDALPGMFNLLWEFADVFNAEVLKEYELFFRMLPKGCGEKQFQSDLEKKVGRAWPPTAAVRSELVSKRRSFLQRMRRKYDEELNPAFFEVQTVFEAYGKRRNEFLGSDTQIEIGRFLGWLRIVEAPGDTWQKQNLLQKTARQKNVELYIDRWVISQDPKSGDPVSVESEVDRIENLRRSFRDEISISELSYDDLFDALSGCHAFRDRLRHVLGGLEGLKQTFLSQNSLAAIKEKLTYLLFGPGLVLERAYDCINDERWHLTGFGESCVMELVGWMDIDRPPINGRTIKALRFLGFGVRG